jgi:hypothetical protein
VAGLPTLISRTVRPISASYKLAAYIVAYVSYIGNQIRGGVVFSANHHKEREVQEENAEGERPTFSRCPSPDYGCFLVRFAICILQLTMCILHWPPQQRMQLHGSFNPIE